MLFMLSQSYDIAVVFHFFVCDKGRIFAVKTEHPRLCCNTLLFEQFGLFNRGCWFEGFASTVETQKPVKVLTICDESMFEVGPLCDGDRSRCVTSSVAASRFSC